jgi:hypothetical protein
MIENLFDIIQHKSPGAIPLYLVIRGSHAYGTNIETSDTDYAGVFIQSIDDVLGNTYKEQINDDNNDIVIYEIRRFLELLGSNNPTVLELLNTPEDCIIYKNPIFDLVLENRQKFITKVCAKSFGGYAKQQISKAKGQDKKQNWEKDKVTRKTPIDFCYVYDGVRAVELSEWLNFRGLVQQNCGLSKIPHCKDLYGLYYDNSLSKSAGFKGVAFEESNDIRLSSVEKEYESMFKGYVSYNKDGYSQHCKDYKSYQEWLENRNLARWIDVKSHGQKIDGKNMMHCKRLMEMALEIGEGKGIIVRRSNAKELISIRKGEVDLQSLIDSVETDIEKIDNIFENSDLPDKLENNFINDLIIKIRRKVYNI